jgi:hypothetical protein
MCITYKICHTPLAAGSPMGQGETLRAVLFLANVVGIALIVGGTVFSTYVCVLTTLFLVRPTKVCTQVLHVGCFTLFWIFAVWIGILPSP